MLCPPAIIVTRISEPCNSGAILSCSQIWPERMICCSWMAVAGILAFLALKAQTQHAYMSLSPRVVASLRHEQFFVALRRDLGACRIILQDVHGQRSEIA